MESCYPKKLTYIQNNSLNVCVCIFTFVWTMFGLITVTTSVQCSGDVTIMWPNNGEQGWKVIKPPLGCKVTYHPYCQKIMAIIRDFLLGKVSKNEVKLLNISLWDSFVSLLYLTSITLTCVRFQKCVVCFETWCSV